MLIVCFFLSIKSLPNLLFGVLCLLGDQSHPLARCICWAGLLGRAVFPPWNKGPNSGSYSTNGSGFGSNLGARWLFSSPSGFYWVHIDWLAPGYPMGAGNPTISRETETQVPAACQPQQPHIKLISQLQKPTRKISDTLIIDTDKKET